MTIVRLYYLVVMAGVVFFASDVLAEAPKQSGGGALLSNACTACHNLDDKSLDGNNISIGPNISAYDAAELEKILKDFRDGKRPSSLISRQAKIYSDEEIKLIAAYIAAK